MMERRACPTTPCPTLLTPEESGPRCRMAPTIRSTRLSKSSDKLLLIITDIPHMYCVLSDETGLLPQKVAVAQLVPHIQSGPLLKYRTQCNI